MTPRSLVVALLLASCKGNASTADAAATTSADAGMRTVIPALGVSIELPSGARNTQRDSSVAIEIRPGTRYAPLLELARAPAEERLGEGRRTLQNGVEISYETRHLEGEGRE